MTGQPEELLDEVRRLFHRLVQVAEALHAGESVTLGMRAIMELLQKKGPVTVPEMARTRCVTRQHVQTLVDALLEQGLVALAPNPAHRRSPLVRLTAPGRQVIDRMKKRESPLYRRIEREAGSAEVQRATRTLRRVQQALGERP